MHEEELMQLGFFEIETTEADKEMGVRCFQLYEYYKGFLRIIISKYKGVFKVEHIYFNSPRAEELQVELFDGDLSAENVIDKIKEHRKNDIPPDEMPESF
ncbi:hypothetical protein FHW36_1011333 [Chitinophaga polysaccharea]|uniref:Uncharacterized protein n=1 Tax=Chitinophaga polysaccharea TaxID=1293035 RepID=A0A561Q4V8_9BACT|nr:hypothetical protein [Chitinophaga polysaccharea]TWF45403.1 hypothetical protein FHW36_1011333 [Chitinophaga polysaccharea]